MDCTRKKESPQEITDFLFPLTNTVSEVFSKKNRQQKGINLKSMIYAFFDAFKSKKKFFVVKVKEAQLSFLYR